MNLSKFMVLIILGMVVGGIVYPYPPSLSQASTTMQAVVTYRLTEAFYENQQTYYYTFNNGTPVLDDGAEVAIGLQYHLVDAEGEPIEGQYDILTANAYEEGYSDLREIIEVTVPDDYTANSITNHTDLLVEDWPQNPTGRTHNSPIARSNSQLQGRDHDPITLWLNDEEISAYDFGEMTHKTAPIYVLIEGFDPDGNPVRINHVPLVDVVHTDEGYSDFWQVTFVTVPNDTPPNHFRKVSDLVEADFEFTPTANVVNCPAIRLEQIYVAYYDDVAYNITYIPQDDTADFPEDLPFMYVPVAEDETNRELASILTVGEHDEVYTGYCQVAHVTGLTDEITNEANLLVLDDIEISPPDSVATCAYLSPYLAAE